MGTYLLTAPDGKKYRVTGENPQGAVQALKKMLGDTGQAAAQPEGRRAIATTQDGGTIWEMGDGSRAFSSPNYSTSNPEQIAKLLKGATPPEVSTSRINQDLIGEHPVAARAAKALEGVPFAGSYTDEIAGALYGAPARDAMRATSRAMDEENPIESIALQLAGGVAATLPVAAAVGPGAVANNWAGRAAQGVGVGAAEGIVSGAGRGTDAQSRLSGAGWGGLIGGAIGGAIPTVSAGAGSLYRGARGALADMQGINKAAGRMGVSRNAARLLSDTLGMDDPQAMRSALAGPGGMLADAGPSAQGALDVVIQSPGEGARLAQRRIDDRAVAAGDNLTGTLNRVMGRPGASASREVVPFDPAVAEAAKAVPREADGWVKHRGLDAMSGDIRRSTARARQSAYDAAYSRPIDYASETGVRLEQTLKRVPGSAIRDANRLMQMEGVQSNQILAQIDEAGNVIGFERLPDVRQWDYIKRALDQAAASGDGAGALGGQTPMGRAYQGLAREIRDGVADAVPEYRTALDTAGDAIGRVQGVKFGAGMMRPGVTREEVSDFLRGATGAELTAVKQGVRQQIDDAIANVRAVATDPNIEARQAYKAFTDLSSPSAQAKMEMLLGKDWPALKQSLDDAGRALGLRARVASNSRTFGRQQFSQMMDDSMAPGRVASGDFIGIASPMRQVWQNAFGTTPAAIQRAQAGVRNELADVLTRPGGLFLLGEIERARKYQLPIGTGQGVTNALNALGLSALPTATAEAQALLGR